MSRNSKGFDKEKVVFVVRKQQISEENHKHTQVTCSWGVKTHIYHTNCMLEIPAFLQEMSKHC